MHEHGAVMSIQCPECHAIGSEGPLQAHGDRLDRNGFETRGHLRGRSAFECERCSAFFFQPFSFPRKRPKESIAIPAAEQAVMRALPAGDGRLQRRASAGGDHGELSSERQTEERRAAAEAAGKVDSPVCGGYVKPNSLSQHTAAEHEAS